ncbi:hypothetical protein NECID01_0064 [Nematocida sp. AWRm77]|nr:hypothetical protein NECID01_0064 [Nematocida sp. AWRm77]
MIESAALRKYVISYFLVHPTSSLCTLVNRIAEKIQNQFIKGEIVFIKNKELTGCIVDTTDKGYLVRVYDDNQAFPQKEEVTKENILRKDHTTKNEVMSFLLSVTRETPLGRVVLGSAVQDLGLFKGQKTNVLADAHVPVPKEEEPGAETKPKWSALSEERIKEAEALEKQRLKEVQSSLLQVPSKAWSAPGAPHSINKNILSLYNSLSTFADFFKLEKFTLDKFVDALFSQEYNEKFVVGIHSKLLKSISHERRKSGKEGLKEIVQVAAEVVYNSPAAEELVGMIHDEPEKENPGFTRIQWFAGDATSKVWQAYMKSFVYDIVHLYDIHVRTNEFAPWKSKPQEPLARAADRILMLLFTVEICMLGLRFRGYFDTVLEEFKEKEKERSQTVSEVKRLKGECMVSEISPPLKEMLDSAEKNLAEIDAEYMPEIVRTNIGTYGEIVFISVERKLFYSYQKEFFTIKEEDVGALLDVLGTEKKKDAALAENIRKFLRLV